MDNKEIKRIYLNEILPKIRKQDLRSAISWCKNEGVQIYSDFSGRFAKYDDFLEAYNRPTISTNEKDLKYSENMNSRSIKNEYIQTKYKPQSAYSQKFSYIVKNINNNE